MPGEGDGGNTGTPVKKVGGDTGRPRTPAQSALALGFFELLPTLSPTPGWSRGQEDKP